MTDKPSLLHSAELGRADMDLQSKDPVYSGFFEMRKFSLRHRLFEGGWSPVFQREIFCRGDAVAGIIYDPRRDEIALIDQFRVGAHAQTPGPWCLEVVAGMMDKTGEKQEAVMARELMEEAGLQAQSMEFICSYLSSPGGTDEEIHLYALICDLESVTGEGSDSVHGLDSENEDIRLRVFTAQQVFDAMFQGRTRNAATLIGLQWLQINRERLRAKY